jgi:signal transduction histidine kinase
LGLIRAIESECAALLKRENVKVTFVREGVLPAIPRDVALCLYRVVQESLKNITKHSQAQSAEIFLKSADNSISLAIRDKGIGFEPAEVRQKPGLGLASMRERIQLVQGEFSIKSQPGQGTAVSVRVPLTGSRI